MKKLLLFIGLAFMAGAATAQSIPNGGFENWTTNTFEDLMYYYTSNHDHMGTPPYTVLKTSDAKSGSYAVKLETIFVAPDTINSFVANGDPSHPVGQGVPYTEQATGITGYYKGTFVNNDSAIVWVIFKSNGTVIGNYLNKIGASQSAYTKFNFTFLPALSTAPDSMIIALTSSNLLVNKGVPGTTVQFDSIAFTGVTAQPNNFNGDFEMWSQQSITTVNQWNVSHVGIQTNDKYSGNYALELRTENTGSGTSQSSATNGVSYPGGTKGGSPFTNQVDTLVFYYKFSASDINDSAQVQLSFKNSGTTFQFISTLLKDTSAYKRVEIPFNLPSVPDSVLIFINSSKTWQNIPASYVGGDLKIDNMFFKSQQIPVSAILAPLTGCVNQPVQISDNSANLPDAWSWDLTGSLQSTSNVQNPLATYTATGSYTVGLIASNSFGSGSLVTQVINIYNVPVVSVTSPTMCAGDSAIVVASGANTYLWSNLVTNDSITVFPSTTANYTVTGTSNGCSATATATVTVTNCTTGVLDVKSQLSIYPNPGAAQFNVQLNETGNVISVFDLSGKKLFARNITGMQTVVDLGAYPDGIYLLEVTGGSGTLHKKIVKQN